MGKDGGPAFPQFNEQRYSDPVHGLIRPSDIYGPAPEGMSLRDWFAGQEEYPRADVLQRLRAREHARMLADTSRRYVERDEAALVAEWRYKMADAMLSEREKEGA